jgi:5'(3')-deoxyribonucleotidase
MKPILLLDCDGPLSNFTKGYLQALFVETGARHTEAEVDRWSIADCDFFKQAARKLNVEHAVLKARVDRYVSMKGFCEDLEVQPGAREAVHRLSKIADIYVVTSPWDSSPTWMYERLHWIVKHFKIPRAHVIQSGTKHLVKGDVFVDDKPAHVERWQEAWPKGKGLLFDMHHNRAHDPQLGRGDWPEVERWTALMGLS